MLSSSNSSHTAHFASSQSNINSAISLHHFTPNREILFLNVALLNKIQKPLIPGAHTWLLRIPPPVSYLEGAHITGMMGTSNVERLWTISNGYAIYLGRTILGQRFLLAVPEQWVQDRIEKEIQTSWTNYYHKLLCCL
jgi:hypothetical protein